MNNVDFGKEAYEIACCISEAHEAIIARWEQRVLADETIHAANKLTEPVLRAHISSYLNKICSILEENPNAKADTLGRKIGKSQPSKQLAHRRVKSGYSLPEALLELSHLRSALIDVCLKGRVVSEVTHLLHAAIDQTMSEAAKEIAESQRQAERTLRKAKYQAQQSANRLDALLSSDIIGCIIAHFDGRITEANDTFLNLLGYNKADLESGSVRWDTITPNEWRFVDKEIIAAIKLSGFSRPRRKEYVHKDGTKLPVLVGVTALEPKEEGTTAAFVLDLREQKKAENALIRAKEDAEAANRLKSAFLANMSHEIRTPIGIMLGFSEILISEDLSRDEQIELLGKVVRKGRELTRLVDDILDLSKVEADQITLEPLKVSILAFVEETIAQFQPEANKKGLKLQTNLASNVPAVIKTDPTRLRQILENVIGNAIKFTAAGTVSVEVKLLAEEPKTKLAFDVTDTGIGIAPDQAERLFKLFSQADSSTTRKYGGTGLGLMLSKRLAEALGGDVILLKSSTGQGSTFTVTIDPALANPNRSNDNISTVPYARSPHYQPLKGLLLLVAEDEPDNQVLVKRILSKAGASVTVVDNGEKAIDYALNGDYDGVLMDIQMPVLDGNNATAELRARGYDRPIIALTAHAMNEQKNKSLACGFSSYLTKPINIKELLEAVGR